MHNGLIFMIDDLISFYYSIIYGTVLNCKPTSFKIFPTFLAPMRITPPFWFAMQFNNFSRFAKFSVGIPKSVLKTGFWLTTGTPFVKT